MTNLEPIPVDSIAALAQALALSLCYQIATFSPLFPLVLFVKEWYKCSRIDSEILVKMPDGGKGAGSPKRSGGDP